jgi:putative peptidoglycan lipid II flippase
MRVISFGILLTILGKILSLLKDMILANVFGSSYVTDSYFTALAIPTLIWLAGYATISSVFLPMYLAAVKNGSEEAQRVANEGVRTYFVLALASAALIWYFAEFFVDMTFGELDPTAKALTVSLTKVLTVGFVFTGYIEVQNVIQRAHGRFLAPLFIPTINNIIAIVAIVVAGYFDNITVAIAGATMAWIVQAPIQRYQTRDIYKMDFDWRVRRKTFKTIAVLSGPVALAVVLDQINLFVGVTLASDFGAGAISHFNYASRLAIFAAGLFSFLVIYFFFPNIARNASLNEDAANGRLLTRSVGIILLSTAPLAAVGLAMRTEIVEVAFGRGAFTQTDVASTAKVFGFYGLGILFIALREILNRTFFAYQKTLPPLMIGFAATLLNLFLSYLLSRQLGTAGIALGASLSASLFVLMQLWALRQFKPKLIEPELGSIFVIAILAAVLAFGTGTIFSLYFFHAMTLMRLVLGSVVALATYAAAIIIFFRISGKDFDFLINLLKPQSS